MKIFITICLISLIKYSACGHFDDIIPLLKTLDKGGVLIDMKGSTVADVQDLVPHLENKKLMDQVTIYADGVDDSRLGLLANALGTTGIANVALYRFEDHELQIIAKIFPQIPLKYLIVSKGDILLSGAKALAENLKESSIHSLNFVKSNVTDEGFKMIVDILPLTRINTLYLWRNGISDVAMEYLVSVLDKTHLKDLYISNVTDAVYNKLNQVKGNINIHRAS